MRRVLVDYARRRGRLKRGSGDQPLPLDWLGDFLPDNGPKELVVLDDALQRLAEVDPRASEV